MKHNISDLKLFGFIAQSVNMSLSLAQRDQIAILSDKSVMKTNIYCPWTAC